MPCPRCGAPSPPAAAYCGQCGAPLAVSIACPRCQAVNDPGSHFCYRCGMSLDGTAAPVAAPAPQETGPRPGGFLVRFLAWLIDGVIVGLVQLIPLAALIGDVSFRPERSGDFTSLLFLLVLSVPALYHTIAVAFWGTTVGKAAFGLRVVTADGLRPGLFRAFFRWVAVSLSLLIFAPILLMVAFEGRKRGLHDLICETVVVRR